MSLQHKQKFWHCGIVSWSFDLPMFSLQMVFCDLWGWHFVKDECVSFRGDRASSTQHLVFKFILVQDGFVCSHASLQSDTQVQRKKQNKLKPKHRKATTIFTASDKAENNQACTYSLLCFADSPGKSETISRKFLFVLFSSCFDEWVPLNACFLLCWCIETPQVQMGLWRPGHRYFFLDDLLFLKLSWTHHRPQSIFFAKSVLALNFE